MKFGKSDLLCLCDGFGSMLCRTVFGKEAEITARTLLDSHKAEQDCNHWMFMAADPGEPSAPRHHPDENQSETHTH